MDGEIVYVDNEGKFLPFQAIERKLQTGDLEAVANKAPKLYLFDILALDSQSLCHLSLSDRRRHLQELVQSLGLADSPKERVIELARS